MAIEGDPVQRYASTLGFRAQPRTILVEGTTDVDLFGLAARCEETATGIDLLAGGLAVAAAGMGQRGGTEGVVRELVSLRAVARTVLRPNGRPMYRFVGLVDNDRAGRLAVKRAHELDTSIVEYKDMFRLQPVLPIPLDLDPTSLRRRFESANVAFRSLDWELEDLLPSSLVDAFIEENDGAIRRSAAVGGRVHRDFHPDGKARFHRFVKVHAMRPDLLEVVNTLRAMRTYLGFR